jgi:hypothetical protein
MGLRDTVIADPDATPTQPIPGADANLLPLAPLTPPAPAAVARVAARGPAGDTILPGLQRGLGSIPDDFQTRYRTLNPKASDQEMVTDWLVYNGNKTEYDKQGAVRGASQPSPLAGAQARDTAAPLAGLNSMIGSAHESVKQFADTAVSSIMPAWAGKVAGFVTGAMLPSSGTELAIDAALLGLSFVPGFAVGTVPALGARLALRGATVGGRIAVASGVGAAAAPLFGTGSATEGAKQGAGAQIGGEIAAPIMRFALSPLYRRFVQAGDAQALGHAISESTGGLLPATRDADGLFKLIYRDGQDAIGAAWNKLDSKLSSRATGQYRSPVLDGFNALRGVGTAGASASTTAAQQLYAAASPQTQAAIRAANPGMSFGQLPVGQQYGMQELIDGARQMAQVARASKGVERIEAFDRVNALRSQITDIANTIDPKLGAEYRTALDQTNKATAILQFLGGPSQGELFQGATSGARLNLPALQGRLGEDFLMDIRKRGVKLDLVMNTVTRGAPAGAMDTRAVMPSVRAFVGGGGVPSITAYEPVRAGFGRFAGNPATQRVPIPLTNGVRIPINATSTALASLGSQNNPQVAENAAPLSLAWILSHMPGGH